MTSCAKIFETRTTHTVFLRKKYLMWKKFMWVKYLYFEISFQPEKKKICLCRAVTPRRCVYFLTISYGYIHLYAGVEVPRGIYFVHGVYSDFFFFFVSMFVWPGQGCLGNMISHTLVLRLGCHCRLFFRNSQGFILNVNGINMWVFVRLPRGCVNHTI